MVLTPRKPGEPPFTLVKVTPTQKGKSFKEIKWLNTAQHARLKNACLKVDDLYATSDIFLVVKDNFHALCELLRVVSKHHPAPDTKLARRPILREVVNTASAFRMFLDHLDSEGKSKLGDAIADELKQAQSREYDSSLSYRLCYQLRNHATHKGFPSLDVSIRSSVEGDSKTASASHYGPGSFTAVLVSIKRDELLRDKEKLNAKVRNELKNLEEKIELVEHFRSAVEALERIHSLYVQKRDNALQSELQLLGESISGETLAENEWITLFDQPTPIGNKRKQLFSLSYTNYPMDALRKFRQTQKC